MRYVVATVAFLGLLISPLFVLAAPGGHIGEISPFEYKIEYSDSEGVTTVNADGIAFVPFEGPPTFSGEVLPEKYWDEYSLYFEGDVMEFTVHITNISRRTYKNLHIIAIQELLNENGMAGEVFSGDSTTEWFVETLGSGQTVWLEGKFEIPFGVDSGIDQTHLQILHGKGSRDLGDEPHKGRVIIDDPQAGLWCPV